MTIKVGNYVIQAPNAGKMWIYNAETGEGAQVNVVDFARVVDRFFSEVF